MRAGRTITLMIAVTSLAGCALDFGGAREPQGGPTAPLVNAAGQSIGTIRLWESPGAVTFRIEGRGLPHGTHGLHVHTTGRCDPPAFETAGPHWNPAQRRHGFNNPAGPHGGDMPNVRVAANGVIGATVTLAGGSHMALLDADGSALVIHAAPDDYTTDPSGNSGARIACAVIPQPLPPR